MKRAFAERITDLRKEFFFSLYQLRNTCHSHIDLRSFIPGTVINDSGHRKPEDGLEFFHGISCSFSVNPIRGDRRDGRVRSGNTCQLFLDLAHFVTGRTKLKIITRPGSRDAGYFSSGVNEHIIPIIVSQNFNRLQSFVLSALLYFHFIFGQTR